MAELPHMPMFWGDYFADTRHLSCVEHGAYLQLIGQYWIDGHGLPDDDLRLSRLVGLSKKEWLAMRPTLQEFFTVSGGVWLHNRVERELANVRARVEQAREAGRASAAARLNGRSNDRSNVRSNGRSTGRATERQPSKSKASKTPLTPLRRAKSSAPALAGGGADDGEAAKPIGEVVKGLGLAQERTKPQ